MSEKAKKETPAAVAAAGVTSETTEAGATSNTNQISNDETNKLKADLQAANERAQAAEGKLDEVKADLTGKLLELNQDYDNLVERNINAESKLSTVENENRALVARAEEAEAKLATAQNQLEHLRDVVAEAGPEKLLYKAENGHTYEFTQSEFRFQGDVHKATEISTELAEQLIAVKSFVLNKI